MNLPRFLYAVALTHLFVSLSRLSIIYVNGPYLSYLVHICAMSMIIYTQAFLMAQLDPSMVLL